MLFNRNIEPSCTYCRFGVALGYDEYVCAMRGIVSGSGFCSAFCYEPTKREPDVMPMYKSPELSEEDFTL